MHCCYSLCLYVLCLFTSLRELCCASCAARAVLIVMNRLSSFDGMMLTVCYPPDTDSLRDVCGTEQGVLHRHHGRISRSL